MSTKVTTMRALSSFVAAKMLRIISLIFYSLIVLLFILIAFLATKYSGWWWIFAFPLIAFVIVYGLFQIFVRRVIKLIYRHPFSTKQRTALDDFSKSLRANFADIPESPLGFALVTLADIIKNREATTLQSLISNTSTLRQDFKKLEEHFGSR